MATGDLIAVTDSVAIGVGEAVAVAIEAGVGVGAGPIVVGGGGVVVAGCVVLAAGDLIAVADSVAIGVGEAVAVAVEAGVGVGAGPIIVGGVGVVVARGVVGAAFDRGDRPNERGAVHAIRQVLVETVAIDEDLGVHLNRQVTGGGELSGEDLEVGSGHTIGIAIQGVPGATHGVVDGDVAPGKTGTRIEVGRPGIQAGGDRAHRRFTGHGIGRALQTDGDPAVVGEVRIDGEEQAVDAVGSGASEDGVVKIRRRVDIGGVVGIPGDGRQEVILILHRDVHPGAAVSREVGDAEGTDEHADVFADDFDFDAVVLSMQGRGGEQPRHQGSEGHNLE